MNQEMTSNGSPVSQTAQPPRTPAPAQPSYAIPQSMPASTPPPATTSTPALTSPPLQPVDAQFFNIARNDGTPMAGLIVLVDSKRNPVRAELHLHEGVTDENGRQAVRQAQHVIEDRYTGPEAIPMQVWQSFLRSDTPLAVQLNAENAKSKESSKSGAKSSSKSSTIALPAAVTKAPAKPLMIAGGVLIGLLLLWGLWAWLGPDAETPSPTSGGVGIPLDASDSPSLANAVLTPVDLPASTELAASVNADPNISLGKRVQMISGLSQTVRSEAGNNAGAEVGSLASGEEVLIVGGPTMLPGVSDTIVWWEVRMPNDQTGWIAANNSSRALLEPLE